MFVIRVLRYEQRTQEDLHRLLDRMVTAVHTACTK